MNYKHTKTETEKEMFDYLENVLYDMQSLRFDFFNTKDESPIDASFKTSLLESFYRTAKRIESVSCELLTHYRTKEM